VNSGVDLTHVKAPVSPTPNVVLGDGRVQPSETSGADGPSTPTKG
jgi:hypothetical protein